jgi:hypothetical protein
MVGSFSGQRTRVAVDRKVAYVLIDVEVCSEPATAQHSPVMIW